MNIDTHSTDTGIDPKILNIRPIKPKRVSAQVFDQIRELIYKGDFQPGQKIPPERELANSMAVSRTSVRNAIGKLVNIGLLTQLQGQGTFVASPEDRIGNPLSKVMTTDSATFEDLLEVRMGLECNGARLAARRATGQDIRAIKKSLVEMQDELKATGTIPTESDTAFHMAITFASKNPVLIHLTRNFYDFLFVGIKKNLAHMTHDRAICIDIAGHHQAIFDSIRNQEPEKAYAAMCAHIRYVQDYFNNRKSIPCDISMKHNMTT